MIINSNKNHEPLIASLFYNNSTYVETGNLIIALDPSYFRPTEVETLLGDPSNAKDKLG